MRRISPDDLYELFPQLSNGGFFHPLRFWVTTIGLAGLEYSARHVVAHQLGQVGGALQQAVEIDAGV